MATCPLCQSSVGFIQLKEALEGRLPPFNSFRGMGYVYLCGKCGAELNITPTSFVILYVSMGASWLGSAFLFGFLARGLGQFELRVLLPSVLTVISVTILEWNFFVEMKKADS